MYVLKCLNFLILQGNFQTKNKSKIQPVHFASFYTMYVTYRLHIFFRNYEISKQKTLNVRFRLIFTVGPIVNMVTEQIYAYDDLSAEIQCIVQGYPEPVLEWHYRKSPNAARTERLNDPVLVKTTALNQYLHTLLVCFF